MTSPQPASADKPSVHPHSLHQEQPCPACVHPSEESDASATSEATTLQRLLIPSPPPGGSSTLPDGSCWGAGGQSSNRSGSVQSVKTAGLEATAAGTASSQEPPAFLQQQQRADTPGNLAVALNGTHASAAAAAAAGVAPFPPLPGHSQQYSSNAPQPGVVQQHTSNLQQQQQYKLQQGCVEQGGVRDTVTSTSAPCAWQLQQQQTGAPQRQQQQHRHQQPGLPPLPSSSRHYQHRPQPVQLPDHHQQRQAQPRQMQQQEGGVVPGRCWACSPQQPGGCERCRQGVRVNQVLQAAAPQAHQHPHQQQQHYQEHQQLHYQHYQQQQQLLHQLQQEQQHYQQLHQFQQHVPPPPGAAAAGASGVQCPTAGPFIAQPPSQQQQLLQLLEHQWLQQQLGMLAQQQPQAQQAQQVEVQQQVQSVPAASRPWGWWRRPGTQHSSNILHRLDAVRPPLLHLHTALGDSSSSSSSSASLLGAMGSSSGGGAEPGVGADISRAWQHLLAVEAQRQQLASLQGKQQQQQQQQGPPGLMQPHRQGPGQQQQHQLLDPSRAADAAGGLAGGDAAAAGSSAAAAAAGAAKPPKRPWQPKMAPDEHNWSEAGFTSLQASCAQGSAEPPGGQGCKWPRALPEHSTCTFAQLMLLHGAGWPNHVLWEHWQAAHAPGSLALFVHMKAGVALAPGMPGRELIARSRLETSLDSRWGDISLVEATLTSLEEVLQRCPHVTHIGLASGHDVPVQLIRPGLLLPGVSLFGMYQFGAPEMVTLKQAVVEELLDNSAMTNAEAHEWGNALTFHHQWMVLSREHAAALVQHRTDIMLVGRLLHKACCSVRAGMAPDEFIVVTALRQMGYVRSVQRVEVKPHMRYPPGCLLNSYPTFVVFPAESSPHPVLWTHLERKVKCQVENVMGQQYHTSLSLNDCLDLAVERCAIFFRKVEVKAARGEGVARLLSTLESMWQGQRKGSTAALKTSSSSTATGVKRRGKRKQGASNPTTPQTSQDAVASPASSAAADMAMSSAPPEPEKTGASVEAASCKRRRELLAIAYLSDFAA